MSDVYQNCPVIENERYLLRFTEEADADDLLAVYSDRFALPFFNSDNCNGDNFYYPTKEKMLDAIRFWHTSYQTKWFVRFTVIDKSSAKAICTAELFHRESADAFSGDGVLRLDVRSDCETEPVLTELFSLIVPPAFVLFDCSEIITKAPVYAVERIRALQRCGFVKSEHLLIGTHDGYAYNGYWAIRNSQ